MFVVVEACIDARLSKLEAQVPSCQNSSIELPASIPASSPLNDIHLIRNVCLPVGRGLLTIPLTKEQSNFHRSGVTNPPC